MYLHCPLLLRQPVTVLSPVALGRSRTHCQDARLQPATWRFWPRTEAGPVGKAELNGVIARSARLPWLGQRRSLENFDDPRPAETNEWARGSSAGLHSLPFRQPIVDRSAIDFHHGMGGHWAHAPTGHRSGQGARLALVPGLLGSGLDEPFFHVGRLPTWRAGRDESPPRTVAQTRQPAAVPTSSCGIGWRTPNSHLDQSPTTSEAVRW